MHMHTPFFIYKYPFLCFFLIIQNYIIINILYNKVNINRKIKYLSIGSLISYTHFNKSLTSFTLKLKLIWAFN